MNTLLSFGLHHLWKRAAVRLLELKPGDRVLDVCGGTADLAIRAVRAIGAPGRVIVYDINWAMMAAGRPKWPTPPGPRSALSRGTPSASLPGRRLRRGLVGFGIRNLTHPEEGFKEMFRVLEARRQFSCAWNSPSRSALGFAPSMIFIPFALCLLLGRIGSVPGTPIPICPNPSACSPNPRNCRRSSSAIGFTRVRYRRLTDGIAVIHLGVKA